MTDALDKIGNRQEKREALFLSATLRIEGVRSPVTTRVRNLSAGGMMVDGHAGLAVETRVLAELRGIGAIEGRVAWVSPGRAGIAFDIEIDPRLARSIQAPKQGEPLFMKTAKLYGTRPGLTPRN